MPPRTKKMVICWRPTSFCRSKPSENPLSERWRSKHKVSGNPTKGQEGKIEIYIYSYLKVLNSVLCNAWNCGTCLQSVLRQMTIYDGNIHYCPLCTRLFEKEKGQEESRFLGVRILFVYFIHICQHTYDPSMYQVLTCLIKTFLIVYWGVKGEERERFCPLSRFILIFCTISVFANGACLVQIVCHLFWLLFAAARLQMCNLVRLPFTQTWNLCQ